MRAFFVFWGGGGLWAGRRCWFTLCDRFMVKHSYIGLVSYFGSFKEATKETTKRQGQFLIFC